ncbi:hypothetical protein AN958_05388 [Leucoagaricus sp. SymC.cos]|nr:hypothetical protein AN958_05388 [Leucoagaricus sp. SymC.cos]
MTLTSVLPFLLSHPVPTTTMFSSIASFLPSSLHIGPSDAQKPPQFCQDDPASEDEQDDLQANRPKQASDQPQTTSKIREKTVNESFVIVRPPPSKSNHPLNLQVQLVPPNIKPPNGVVSQSSASVQSGATIVTDTDHTLARTPSGRSESSYTTYGSSTSSFSSIASSSASARRTIVPLYNLQAHNVMTNVIVDAGTDAKIAKFQRRGIVLLNLASLEPVEVWGDSPSSTGRASINLNVDERPRSTARSSAISTRSGAPSSRAHTPERLIAASSAPSLNAQKQSPPHLSHQIPSRSQPQQHQFRPTEPSLPSDVDSDSTPTLSTPRPQPPTQSKRNIFGKLFQTGSSNKKLAVPANTTPRSSPRSPSFAISPSYHQSFQATPKTSLQSQQQGSTTSAASGNRRSEKTHARNISLTSLTSPIKSTLKNNKNRLSSAIAGSSSSSSLNVSAPPEGRGVGLGITSVETTEKPLPSPNRSTSSLAASESVESGSVAYSSLASGNHLLHVPSLLHTSTHVQQSSTGPAATTTPQTQLQQLQSRPPVLGIQPTFVSALGSSSLSGPSDTKKIRALMYVWLVRKWLKGSPHDELGLPFPNVTGKGIFMGLGAKGRDEESLSLEELGAGVEVRFEWKRGKVRGSGRGRAGKERSETDAGRPQKKRNTATTAGEWDDREDREGGQTEREKSRDSRQRRSEDKRLSSLSAKSNQSIGSGAGEADSEGVAEGTGRSGRRRSLGRLKSAVGSGSEAASGVDGRDDGEESDPEDSETPWVCTMKVRRTAPAPSTRNGFSNQSPKSREKDVLKLKIGTLSPTPHHPKVVAMLKVPFPLPDVEVERLNLRRRSPGSTPGQGVGEMGEIRQAVTIARDFAQESPEGDQEDVYRGLELTAEELKDIVCSTALWLIVREGTGGVGRISRKGDGWKLRS